MTNEKIDYNVAMQQLNDIVAKLEGGNVNIDTLSEELKHAQKLIQICKDRLTKTDEEIKALLNQNN